MRKTKSGQSLILRPLVKTKTQPIIRPNASAIVKTTMRLDSKVQNGKVSSTVAMFWSAKTPSNPPSNRTTAKRSCVATVAKADFSGLMNCPHFSIRSRQSVSSIQPHRPNGACSICPLLNKVGKRSSRMTRHCGLIEVNEAAVTEMVDFAQETTNLRKVMLILSSRHCGQRSSQSALSPGPMKSVWTASAKPRLRLRWPDQERA